MNLILTALVTALLALAQSDAPTTRPAVIDEVMRTAGSDAWNDGTRLRFTFSVDVGGEKKAEVTHDWDLTTGVDTVTWGGKTVKVNVWQHDAANAGDDEKAAFAKWTNDSYWLLMPLKLGDSGVKFGPVMMTRDQPPSRANVTMSFAGVGLTPGDRYDLSIDLRKNEIDRWTYHPNAEKSVTWMWTDYRDVNGLRLAMDHPNAVEGGPRIYFTDVSFERKGDKGE